MKGLSRSFLVGLSILLPVILSVQLIIWTFKTMEAWLKSIWLVVLPEDLYFPGMAALAFLILVTLIGYSSKHMLARRLLKLPGDVLERTPVIQSIYTVIKDFLDLLGGKTFSDQSVVWVELPGSNLKLMGIVTKQGSDRTSKLSELIEADEVAVYLPMSYQAGGYMVVVPGNRISQANIGPGEALKLIMSAGLGQKTSVLATGPETVNEKAQAADHSSQQN